MRTTTLVSLLCYLLAGTSALADQGLFSRVSGGSVLGDESAESTARSEPSARLSGTDSLSDALTRAGFSPKRMSPDVISAKVERGGWSLPVLFTFSEDRRHLRMVVMLNTLKEGNHLTAEQLQSLLDANRTSTQSTYFAYSTKRRRIELHRVIANRAITSARLRDELSRLGAFAEDSQALWKIDAPSASSAAAAAPGKSANSANGSTKKPSLVGKWIAARSKSVAFALQLNADNTFALVTVSGGKTSKSNGDYKLVDKRLTLVDSKGTKLVGAVELSSASEFVFTPENSSGEATGLRFRRAT